MQNNLRLICEKKSVKGNYWFFNKPHNIKIDKLKNKYNISDILASLLINRGVEEEKISFFLMPFLKKNLPDPSILKNMNKSVNILADKIINGENLGLLGDYDVDGATSSAILFNYLKEISVTTEVFIPDRIRDGYGISTNSIDFFKQKKTSLIISLDCGSNDTKTIEYAKNSGIDVIVIDHHEIKNLSNPLSIINPKLSDDNSGLENLCTAGLVFFLIIGLNRELRNRKFFEITKEPNIKEYLDLVAIGTICDLVVLKDTNRLLVKKGLEFLNFKANKGINVLKSKLNLKEILTANDLAYYIGPCINAAGRIGNSKLGFDLLTSEDSEELNKISDQLITNNKERKTLESMSYEEAKIMADKDESNNFIFVASSNWHPGIVGIIASKLVEAFDKPSFVISIQGDKCIGSVRSIGNIDISKIIAFIYNEKIIESGGGHAMAGGIKLDYKNLKKLKLYLKENNLFFEKKVNTKTLVDIVTEISQINFNLINNLELLEPYGVGNREPRFAIKNISSSFSKLIGKDHKHISCVLEDIFGNKLNGIAFNSSYNELGKALMEKKNIHALGKLSINEWLGKKSLQFFIEDITVL